MQLKPYPGGRFTPELERNQQRLEGALNDCTLHERPLISGQYLLREGDPLSYLYLVPLGRVSMHISATNGRRFQLGETDCYYHLFGEMEFFNQTPCQWSVVALEEFKVQQICPQKLQQRLLQEPELTLFFASAITYDFQHALGLYTQRVLHPISYNIAHELLLKHQKQQLLGGFNRTDIEAERFGTTDRVYRRAVKELIEKGIAIKGKQGLEVADLQKLLQFLGFSEE
ncbi:Crp/Fnr family transcriptional regulator [Dongshaea marina]|uniref:Crp/Fnr family transcriptional regulator n=1 Tax=Dongshaea marina TaxID=2047966 RepID=UPI000D3EB262|nr:Crp/Fnr family transcriptional regulator [Dongshaea marina]